MSSCFCLEWCWRWRRRWCWCGCGRRCSWHAGETRQHDLQVNKSKDGNQHKNSVDKTHQSERFRLGSVGAFLRTLQINLSHYLVCIRLNITQFVTIVQACWYISGAETIQ